MKATLFIIALLLLVLFTASDPFFADKPVAKHVSKKEVQEVEEDVSELSWQAPEAFEHYLQDADQRVSDQFSIAPYYYPNVRFWFLIYTHFASSQAVIHDKANLSIIYKVLDFSSLHEKALPKNTIYVLQQKISQEKLILVQSTLHDLVKNPFEVKASTRFIFDSLEHAGVKLPTQKQQRSAFFNRLRDNIRTQTGQKDFILEGMMRSLPYQKFLAEYFRQKNLPPELLAIPFLESSFNPKAHSRVGARGVWQFMPLIASFYVPKRTPLLDYRSNVGVASVSAAYLMSENFRIMKSWDLAVTAYNSGTKHLLKSKRALASQDVDLEDIIKHSDSEHFGFASKNFYSEFLALAHTLAYREEVFRTLHKHERYNVDEPLLFYMSKCSVRLDKVLDEDQMDDVLFHNYQIGDVKKNYPRGLILSTKVKLPKSKFFLLEPTHILKNKPKDWSKFLRNQSCSTK